MKIVSQQFEIELIHGAAPCLKKLLLVGCYAVSCLNLRLIVIVQIVIQVQGPLIFRVLSSNGNRTVVW